MERTFETSFPQVILTTAEVLKEYVRQKISGEKINIPRTSLAISNALTLAFPDELKG